MPSEPEHARPGTFLASDRHRLEANYYDYRRLLKRHIRRFGPVRTMQLGATALVAAPAAVFTKRPSGYAETGTPSRSLRPAR